LNESVRVIQIFVASPGDVQEERARVRRVAEELNLPGGLAQQCGCVFQVLDWHQASSAMGRPEQVILDQLPVKSWDVFVGILWTRFGSPSGLQNLSTGYAYDSGTEEEFWLAYRSWQDLGRPAILFFHKTQAKTQAPDLRSIDPAQLQKVQRFLREFETDGSHPGLVKPYNAADDFERELRIALTRALPQMTSRSIAGPSTESTGHSISAPPAGRGNEEWWQRHRAEALREIGQSGLRGSVEFRLRWLESHSQVTNPKLRNTAQQAANRYGWPTYIDYPGAARVSSLVDGIRGGTGPRSGQVPHGLQVPYLYWALSQTGDLYLLESFVEDEVQPESLFYDTRIAQAIEFELFASRLYESLGNRSGTAELHISYDGLSGRSISASGKRSFAHRGWTATENEVTASLRIASSELVVARDQILSIVERMTSPMFNLFGFFDPPIEAYCTILGEVISHWRTYPP
jgi:hypothetical protein